MKTWKCCSYERLSKEDNLKKDESSSIESQRLIIKSFCAFNKLELVADYYDDGYSGGNFDRPDFKKMIKDIETGKINCVITKDLSRLGREIYKTGNYIEDYFTDKNVRYIAINDGYDSLTGDNMLAIRLGVNDLYLRDTSKKIISSFREMQKQGKYIGSFPKYGYLKDKNDKNHLVIDPVASLVVKRIFNMALSGYSAYKIAEVLTLEKVPIPIVYKKEPRSINVTENDGYGIWKAQTIKNILKSEMYIGNMVQNTYNKIRYNSKKTRATKREEYIIKENTHEPIIDKETFKLVNDILNSRSKISTKKSDKYLFAGLLRCKECGHTIGILEKKNKKNNSHYTQCNLYAKKGKYGLCTIHRINYTLLEADLLNLLRVIGKKFLKSANNNELINLVNQVYLKDRKKVEEDLDKVNLNINKINKTLENLYTDKLEGVISVSLFQVLQKKYIENLNEENIKKDNLNSMMNDLNKKSQKLDYDKCYKIILEFVKMKNPSRELITELIEKIEIDENKKIKVYFKFQELEIYVR